MLSSGSSSTDSEVDASVQRGTALASKRKDAFELPQGAVLVNDSDDGAGAIGMEEFDWNSIKDDKNIELWLVRVPDSIKPKHLNDTVFSAPSSSSTHTLGQIKRKHETYDLWSLGDRDENDVDHEQIGGDEMKGISCLLPRKSKDGKLYLCPKPIARRLVLAASPPTPGTQSSAVVQQNPPRHSYPPDRFKHRYTPYGSSTPIPVQQPSAADSAMTMDVDQEGDTLASTQKPKKRSKLTDGQKKATKKSKAAKP